MEQWYDIHLSGEDDHCYQWPGNSGKNSMREGTCHHETDGFSYLQWTTCDCTANEEQTDDAGHQKHNYLNQCIVDNPTTLCSILIDNSACVALATEAPPSGASTDAPSEAPSVTTATDPTNEEEEEEEEEEETGNASPQSEDDVPAPVQYSASLRISPDKVLDMLLLVSVGLTLTLK